MLSLGQGSVRRAIRSWLSLVLVVLATVQELRGQGSVGEGRTVLTALECQMTGTDGCTRLVSEARYSWVANSLHPDTSWRFAGSAADPPSGSHPAEVRRLRLGRLAGATAGAAVANVAAYAHFHKVWWDHPRTRFHFYRGWRRRTGAYDLGPDDSLWHHVDKCGHLFSASQLSRYGAATARWVGLQPSQADWAGFLLASVLMLEIEVYDGFFAEWGFSLGDFLANELGAALPLLQRRHPTWRRVALKLSYWPSGDPVYGRYIVEDYAGMTFWLCLDAHLFLPEKARPFWPDLIDVAIGYGTTAKTGGKRELYVALDLDLRKVQVRNSFLRSLVAALEAVHLPAPALRVTPSTVAYLFYF